jgi:hypothetical protein
VINFNDVYSYLVVFVEDEPISFHVNKHLKNELYVDTLEQIKELDDPSNVILTISDEQFKMISEMIQFNDVEALDKVTMGTYDKETFELKFAKYFEFDED